ncbi:hypothetical protein H2248_012287 [Termitomyces sp. 'cryptogamus']|nr:hypothetical protein H2248_012287 [Termitomyces sp. 'cryptogamus']
MIRPLHISTTRSRSQIAGGDSSTDNSPLTSLTDSSDSPLVPRRLFSGQGNASSVKDADDDAYRDGLNSEVSIGEDETPYKRGTRGGIKGLEKRVNNLFKDTQIGRRCCRKCPRRCQKN